MKQSSAQKQEVSVDIYDKTKNFQFKNYIINSPLAQVPFNIISEIYTVAQEKKDDFYESVNDFLDDCQNKLKKRLIAKPIEQSCPQDEKQLIKELTLCILAKKAYDVTLTIEQLGFQYSLQVFDYLKDHTPQKVTNLLSQIDYKNYLLTMKAIYDVATEQFLNKIYQPTTNYISINFLGMKNQFTLIYTNVKGIKREQIKGIATKYYEEIMKIKNKETRDAYIAKLKQYLGQINKLISKEKAHQVRQKSIDYYNKTLNNIKNINIENSKNYVSEVYKHQREYLQQNFENIKKLIEDKKKQKLAIENNGNGVVPEESMPLLKETQQPQLNQQTEQKSVEKTENKEFVDDKEQDESKPLKIKQASDDEEKSSEI